MAEKTLMLQLPAGGTAEGVEVAVAESNEKWSILNLEDGSVLKVKFNVLSVFRLSNQYDSDGNPTYLVRGQPTTAVVSAPAHLLKK